MNPFVAEFLGTMILIILGNGVVANVVLAKTKGHGGGWIVITAGWGIAVFVGALCSAKASGAHLNPALTLGLVAAGKFEATKAVGYIATKAVGYIIAQMLGAMVGATIVFAFYRAHFLATNNADDKLACFCTSPNIRGAMQSLFCEAIGTFVLVLAILLSEAATLENMIGHDGMKPPLLGLGSLGLVPVALLVFGIGLSLGGTTGYAINPARDLGPRLMHFLLPIPGKRDSDWAYAWIPVVGPILGALLAAGVFLMVG